MSDEEQKRHFAIMIADIIQELLQDSDELTGILETASHEGYDILLTVFSGIMVRRRENSEVEDAAPDSLPNTFEFTEKDKEFLQSIGVRISAEDEPDSDDVSEASDLES